MRDLIAAIASFSSSPSVLTLILAPFSTPSESIPMILFASTSVLSFIKVILDLNLEAVCTKLAAGLACSPTLLFTVNSSTSYI